VYNITRDEGAEDVVKDCSADIFLSRICCSTSETIIASFSSFLSFRVSVFHNAVFQVSIRFQISSFYSQKRRYQIL